MSGGVDSSVTAALLQQQGYDVQGIFMKNWSPETIQSLTDCPWEQDQADAAAVCETLGIPFHSVNFEREYKERVVDYFLREYEAGRTPNPDVMCNKEIKFKAFLEEANRVGAEYIATGHYAQIAERGGTYYVKRGKDLNKDQSYFLWGLSQEALARTLFPVGGYAKPEVRELARSFSLPTAAKKDSQGICFIGHIDLKRFLQEQISAQPGLVYALPDYQEGVSLQERLKTAVVIGKHPGVMYYTLGERANALIDNGLYRHSHDNREVPNLYIVCKDSERQALYVSDTHNDPHLFTTHMALEESWLRELSEESPLSVQVRYQQKDRVEIMRIAQNDDRSTLETKQPLWAVAPGQSAVIYQDDLVVGGGIISNAL